MEDSNKCPGCQATLHPEIVRCPHCGYCLQPMIDAITQQTVGRLVGGGVLKAEGR